MGSIKTDSSLSQGETVSLGAQRETALDFRLRRGQVPRGYRVYEAAGVVGAVAKWLIHRASAAAKADGGPTGQAKWLALRINQLEIAFDTQVSIIVYGDFCARHLRS
jgi:hypothetical protein